MQIQTNHFGPVEIEVEDVLLFPRGIIALEDCRHWVLLADAENGALAWLQCVTQAEIALPVVSPRRFAPEYQVRVTRGQLLPLELSQFDQAYVLAIVSRGDQELTLNLKAPLIINLGRRLGRQVITTDEQPLALELPNQRRALLRSDAVGELQVDSIGVLRSNSGGGLRRSA